MMDFQYFIANSKVIKGKPDNDKAKALIRMSKTNLVAVRLLPKDESNASIILLVSNESLRQILDSISLKEGYKVFLHEAYTYYLLYLGENAISAKFDRLRRLRNGINYYGKPVNIETASNALDEIEDMRNALKNRYLAEY